MKFTLGLLVGLMIGQISGYYIRKNGERLAGPHFIMGGPNGRLYLCVAEFDKRGDLIRHENKENIAR